jgi:Holliday junction resolvase RusA-like endonuclease
VEYEGIFMELNLILPLPTSINSLYVNEYKYNPTTKKKEPTGARVLGVDGLNKKKQIQKEAMKQLKGQEWDYEKSKEIFLYMDTFIYFNRVGRDDDNIYKLLKDSLQKIVYENDSRVLVRTQKIVFDTSNPRVELHIHPVNFIGIFDNKDELEEFESNCKSCNRYGRNCSILNKAKEGRVQEEIDLELLCSKYEMKKSTTK